jgi:hypothetical protein
LLASTRLHGVTFQKLEKFVVSEVRTPNVVVLKTMVFSGHDKAVALTKIFGQNHECCCNPESSFMFRVRHLMVFNVNKEKL